MKVITFIRNAKEIWNYDKFEALKVIRHLYIFIINTNEKMKENM